MNTNKKMAEILDNVKINVKIKLSALYSLFGTHTRGPKRKLERIKR